MALISPVSAGIGRLAKATGYSIKGLRHAFAAEPAFRQEMVVFVIALPLAFWIGRSALEVALLLGSLVLLMVVELLNTAIELIVDRITTEQDAAAGQAKDVASAAVFISILIAAGAWLTLLGVRLFG